MFKKLKDKIEEEFKQAPLKFPVSVQQLAQVISPSQSVNSLTEINNASSLTYSTEIPNVSTDFFSIGGEDDLQEGFTKMPLTMHNVDLTASSPSTVIQNTSRSRRSSLSSVTSEASSLFPIYESSLNQNFFQSDLESEMEDGMSGQIEKISKEQLYHSFKKVLNRYNKYKGRYSDLIKHYKELQHENFKTKNVLQETQDKALRRMAELREQCQLEQKAKAHLEESLRNDMEERDHIIDTLKTKISLLSNEKDNMHLIDLDNNQEIQSENNTQFDELLRLKSQNNELQNEVERLKKIKETACHIIHRCDTTINEATEDVRNDNLKQKMSELKSEIQKMKTENESLSHLLSKNTEVDEDRKSQTSIDNSLIIDLSSLKSYQGSEKMDDKDKKIDKLNNLLLKCKEKINGLNAEIKAKNLIIEDNKKKIKELKDEIVVVTAKEEENVLSIAEMKKTFQTEMNDKEEQIKALAKESKIKEKEFVKEKEEIVKNYEEKIRNLTSEFNKEMKTKVEQNQKLMEDLKAKKIVGGSLDKIKNVEDGLANILEFVKKRSSIFEDLAKTKSREIEMAQQKLEERMASAKKNLVVLLQNKQTSKLLPFEEEVFKQQKALESQSVFKMPSNESVENFHVVEKLKSDVVNLSTKIDILESELEQSRKHLKMEKEDGDKWKAKCVDIENECAKLTREFERKKTENFELGKTLTIRNEELKKIENEKELLKTASKEKIETESKLREYVEKYNKLEKENGVLQNDLMEKCDKLIKDLNENKEKIKNLEGESKAKSKELEIVKKKQLIEEKKKAEENQQLKYELENLKQEMNAHNKKYAEDLQQMKSESDQLRAEAAEKIDIKSELENKAEETNKLKAELKTLKEQAEQFKENFDSKLKELTQEKESNERLKNELEALRGNLKVELKEKEENSILVDKLTQECNLLLAEIENLKKIHSTSEKKLEIEVEMSKKELFENLELIQTLQHSLADSEQNKKLKDSELENARKQCQSLKEEIFNLKSKQNQEKLEINKSVSELEKIKVELLESKKLREKSNNEMEKSKKERDDAWGDLQLKEDEVNALKNNLKSIKQELLEKVKQFEEEKFNLLLENENKLSILKDEIKFINSKHEEDMRKFEENLNFEMKEVNEKMVTAEKTSAELLDKLEKITSERDELKMASEEKNLKIFELENCMLVLKSELDEKFNTEKSSKNHQDEIRQINIQYDKEIAERDEKIEALKKQLFENEEEISSRHREEIKEIIIQYDSEIAKRDDEIDNLKPKLIGYDDALERLKSAKEELKTLRMELADKEMIIESKIEEEKKLQKKCDKKMANEQKKNEDVDKGRNKELIERLEKEKSEMERVFKEKKLELEKEIEKVQMDKIEAVTKEKKMWEERLKEVNAKHEKEIKEWNILKKNINIPVIEVKTEEGVLENVDLENTSKVAVAALESGSGSLELLQKQVIQQAAEIKEIKKQHKKEIIDLKKSMSTKRKSRRNSSSDNLDWYSGTLDNDTEHEYLKNILYEYMMGKEQLVLAKVLSAIVKFNEQQTHNVLEKEQQRQTLLGQLGLL